MPTTIDALEEVVSRHGRTALDDPMTLTGALRSLTDPPPEDDVSALAAAAGTGAAGRLRAAVEQGRTPEQALDDVAPESGDDRSRWACAQLGAALGLLPRSLAADPQRASSTTTPVTVAATPDAGGGSAPDTGSGSAPDTGSGSTPDTGDGTAPDASSAAPGTGGAAGSTVAGGAAAGERGTADGPTETIVPAAAGTAGGTGRGRKVALAGGVVVLLLAIGGGVLLTRGGTDGGQATGTVPQISAPPQPAAPSGGAAPTSQAPPADPRAAFTDPVMRATAEPYLRTPGTTCERTPDPIPVLREQVTCRIASGTGAAIFSRYYDPSNLTSLRALVGDDETTAPGSLRTLRWEYVAGRPGVRAGIPVGAGRAGVGTRIRWTTRDGDARLYFDEDATGVVAQLGLLNGGDPEQLRMLWADPNG